MGKDSRSPLDKTVAQDEQNKTTNERLAEQTKTTNERIEAQQVPGEEMHREMPKK